MTEIIEEKIVHFTPNFEGLTNIAREEWRGFNLDWAIDCLESAGLPNRAAINSVLSGKMKMVNMEGNPDEGRLVPDDDPKAVDTTWHAFGFIVDPATYQYGTEAILRRGFESMRDIRNEVIYIINCYNQEMHAVRSGELAEEILNNYSDRVLQDCGFPSKFARYGRFSRSRITHAIIDLDMVREYIDEDFIYYDAWFHKDDKLGQRDPDNEIGHNETYREVLEEMAEEKPVAASPSLMTVAMTGDVEAYVQRQLELDASGLPDSVEPSENVNGYITPDGKYYPCGAMEHIWLASTIVEKLQVKEESLVKCAQSQLSPNIIGFTPPVDSDYPNNEQKLTMAQWCLAHKQSMPEWAKPKG